MDINVCSLRVHDGYATIRARGRNRPQAVYRSDSEELLKETGGPYALPKVSNFPLSLDSQMPQQVPRWSDFGRDRIHENYGTLRGTPRRAQVAEESGKVTLNTFSSKGDEDKRSPRRNGCVKDTLEIKNDQEDLGGKQCRSIVKQGRNHLENKNRADYVLQNCDRGTEDRLYDTVPLEEENYTSERGTGKFFPARNNGKVCQNGVFKLEQNLTAVVVADTLERQTKDVVSAVTNPFVVNEPRVKLLKPGGNSEKIKQDAKSRREAFAESKNKVNQTLSKEKQPIYAVPNVLFKNRRGRPVVVVDGNYVPSGDLYRTTAKYIEDINKNIAEIDKSYEELKSTSNSKNSAYGVINKVAKAGSLDSTGNLYGYRRKRDMAPMPPISPNFGQSVEDRSEAQNVISRREVQIKKDCLKNSNGRPNSYGKLPPRLLPRSSSIENTSRHSTGSTTTSSTRSTESLYAISESLTELPRPRTMIRQDAFNCDDGTRTSRPGSDDAGKHADTEGSDEAESKDELSSSDEDASSLTRSLERSPVTSTIRRNRSRVDQVDGSHNRVERSRSSKIAYEVYPRPRLHEGKVSNRYYSRHDSLESKSNGSTNNFENRRYGTLPNRRPSKICSSSSRPLHKSSEDVLDGERTGPRQGSEYPRRSCASTSDVSNRKDEGWNERWSFDYPDATDVILKGQMKRQEVPVGRGHQQRQDRFSRLSGRARTRHNSLESEDDVGTVNKEDSPEVYRQSEIGFATLPRRGNLAKDQGANDPIRRFSGNVPILEPLYEHAVSDPVKPRSATGVIPWWELATRKYRHRSCPSLQAHVVSAFEQSLSNMTQRLQQLTATAEKKDSELQELRDTIERLRKQSAEAGLNGPTTASNGRRHTLGDSDSGTTGCTGNSNHQGAAMARQLSADSVTSLNSLSSACSASSHHKKKGWLRSSFSKAFSRSRKNRHGSVSDAEDCKDGPSGDLSAPNSPRLPTASKHDPSSRAQGSRNHAQKSPEHENPLTGSKSSSALYKAEDEDVDELKKQLREKDLVLTDIRLEALSSAHQLESLKDTVIKMRNEMLNLKQNNERLQRLVTSKSLTSSQSSLPSDPDRRFSMTEVASSVAALSNGDTNSTADQLEDLNVPEHPVVPSATTTSNEPILEQDTDGKRINVAVYLGSEKNFNYNLYGGSGSDGGGLGEPPHCVIANVCISNKTTWDTLDSTLRRCFKEYVSRVDPVTNLGLGVECVAAYHLGEASRCTTDSQHPELLPCGYLIGHVKTIYLVLSGYSWLAVDTLIPRSIVQRLISLLTEHRRVILCGPSGTGKSYLAGKLAHALVDADTDVKDAAAVATFNVDHKSSKELRQYLAHIAERCDSNAADELPRVIILENLQHAASLGELFSGLLGTRHSSCPAIIGTMSQATCSTTNLQLHHNFRWVLCANHMEPVKGFLGRYLRRKLLEHELRESGGTRNAEMAAVVEWLPRVWLHLNKFLETHSSSDVTIGPRLFLSCPMEVAGSQVWFTDLWNYSVIPYLVEAVREGLTLYGRRIGGNGNGDSAWEDPAQFITTSYPWISTHAVHGGSDALLRLRPEDVGYDMVTSGHTSGVGASSVKSLGSTHSDTEGDPLLNMLMRLQEAANYSSPHSNDSDSVTSLDSSHTRHSEDLSSSTSSSRGVESAL